MADTMRQRFGGGRDRLAKQYEEMLSQISGLEQRGGDTSTGRANNYLDYFREAEQNQRGVDRSGMQGSPLGNRLASATAQAAGNYAKRDSAITDAAQKSKWDNISRRLGAVGQADSFLRPMLQVDINDILKDYARNKEVEIGDMTTSLQDKQALSNLLKKLVGKAAQTATGVDWSQGG